MGKRILHRPKRVGCGSWDACLSFMGTLNVSGLIHWGKLTPTRYFLQTCSMIHGHTRSQGFLTTTNSLLWRERLGKMVPLGGTTTCVVCFSPSIVFTLTDYLFPGGDHRYRSPQEYYPHLHWLLDNAGGVNKPCICQYCDSDRTQQQINQIYPLPPQKESPKGPSAPKKQKKTRKAKNPRGVTSKRGLVMNRNSITTGPLFTLGPRGQNCGTIGHRRSRPMQS